MKYFIFSLFIALTSNLAVAQTTDVPAPILKPVNKLKPVQLIADPEVDYTHVFNHRPDKGDYKEIKFKLQEKYNPQELSRLNYVLKNNVVPPGLQAQNRNANLYLLPYYKSYYVGYLKMNMYSYSRIVFVPKAENNHMPENMRPETDEGFYLMLPPGGMSFGKLNSWGKTYVPPVYKPQAQQRSNVTFSSVSLSRWERSKGVFILWYGTGSTVKYFQAFTVDFDAKAAEQTIADDLKKKASSSYDYIGYTFKSGYTCKDTYNEIARKLNVSLQQAQDLRLGSCSDSVWKY